MKRNIILTSIISLLFCAACDDMQLTTPSLNISVDTENAVMFDGDIPVFTKGEIVKFNIDADADIITFYSGEPGMMYQHKDRTSIDGLPYMQFEVQLEGTAGGTFPVVYLEVLLSSDFQGFTKDAAIDAQNITNATWNDITESANIPTVNATNPSQRIDLSDYAGKPLYAAFRYTRPANTTNWFRYQIRNFNIYNEADGFSYPIVNTGNAGWTVFDFNAPEGTDPYLSTGGGTANRIWDIRNAATDSRIYIGYNSDIDNDDWAITAAIDLTSVSPDLGEGIKAYGDDNIREYQYIYNTTGTFTVSFIGINSRYSDTERIVKEVTIKVID